MNLPAALLNAQRLVAVCDVLGFSDLVTGNPTELVVENAVGWLRKALKHSVVGGNFPAATPPTKDLETNPHVSTVWFSDTILFYTRRDTDEAVSELIQVVASLLFETILEGSTKIRAGIAYGDVHVDAENSIYVGRPIIEAHRMEKCEEWAGAALTESACGRISSCGPGGEIARWWTTKWGVPLKGGGTVETLAVNWNHCVHDPAWRLRWSSERDTPPTGAPESMVAKFWNTKRFHETYCDDCRK